MKVKRLLFTGFSMKTFTFSYLPVTITGLPTYYNWSSYIISKKGEVGSGIKMFKPKTEKTINRYENTFETNMLEVKA